MTVANLENTSSSYFCSLGSGYVHKIAPSRGMGGGERRIYVRTEAKLQRYLVLSCL